VDVAVIGLGLIGGSALRALAGRGHRVTGFDADPATRATARTAAARVSAGHRWQVAGTVRDAIAHAELVVLAVPLPALPGVLDELADYDGLVTDVTSVKGPVRELAAARLRLGSFVGGHPMAGKETSGFAASDPELFAGCAWVLCLEPEETALPDWLAVAELVTSLGARVVPVTAAEHDATVAAISHVPHLLAAALALVLVDNPLAGTLAAGSFSDGTRVAATRPELIAAMCGGNATAVHRVLHQVLGDLDEFENALTAGNPMDELLPRLRLANAARNAWPPVPGEPAELPVRTDVLLRLGRVGGWMVGVDRERRKIVAMRPETDRNGS
jgi:prephenate dehydrogenase